MNNSLNKIIKNQTTRFVNSVANNNFSEANKYLRGIIENKLRAKISNSRKKPLF